MKKNDRHPKPLELIDLLHSRPSGKSFDERVAELRLSRTLKDKLQVHLNAGISSGPAAATAAVLSAGEEKELALEVLMARNRFTEIILSTKSFRQAALTVIQNIYLFRNRKIFFGTDFPTAEIERQEALLMLSGPDTGVPLSKTFQHLIIARVWNRINSSRVEKPTVSTAFEALHEQVEKLNTLRNVYMVMSAGLVHSLARKTSNVYRQSLPYEDAVQVGCFGIARAAYRYHPSCGVRFSTYAANWIRKEIQRQALGGRLVRISANIVERYAQALKTNDAPVLDRLSSVIGDAPAVSALSTEGADAVFELPQEVTPSDIVETRQMATLLHHLVDTVLTGKSSDVIKRRFGLPPYSGEQSIVDIGKVHGVSRSGIYQMERRALKKIADHLQQHLLIPA